MERLPSCTTGAKGLQGSLRKSGICRWREKRRRMEDESGILPARGRNTSVVCTGLSELPEVAFLERYLISQAG